VFQARKCRLFFLVSLTRASAQPRCSVAWPPLHRPRYVPSGAMSHLLLSWQQEERERRLTVVAVLAAGEAKELKNVKYSITDDGIAVVKLDMQNSKVNTLGMNLSDEMTYLMQKLVSSVSSCVVFFPFPRTEVPHLARELTLCCRRTTPRSRLP
jgi:hypothetical protein